MRRFLHWGAVAALGALGGGCGDDSGQPATEPVMRIVDDEDAGGPPPMEMDAGDEDAGTAIPPVCERVDVIQSAGGGGEVINATTLPDDFAVSVVRIGFDCDARSLVLAHAGGFCPNGDGHELTIALDSLAIEAGTLPTGPITLDALRSGIQVRYRRHDSLNPGGEWGNCGSGSAGLLELATVPSLEADQVLEGRYQLTLTPCDGRLNEDIDVVGSFTAMTDHSLVETCGD